MKKRPTIVDIANEAGVTHSTVSRVINNNPAISEETKTKVLHIISEMKYQPNLIARSLVRKTDRSYIMSDGKVLISGTAEELISDPKARQIYLGEKFRM